MNQKIQLHLIKNLVLADRYEEDSEYTGEQIGVSETMEELMELIPESAFDEENFDEDLQYFQINDSEYYAIWIITPDVEKAVDFLMDQLPKSRKIHAGDLERIHLDYINRIIIRPKDSWKEEESAYTLIQEEFEKRTNELPNGPDYSDWEELDESLSK